MKCHESFMQARRKHATKGLKIRTEQAGFYDRPDERRMAQAYNQILTQILK